MDRKWSKRKGWREEEKNGRRKKEEGKRVEEGSQDERKELISGCRICD